MVSWWSACEVAWALRAVGHAWEWSCTALTMVQSKLPPCQSCRVSARPLLPNMLAHSVPSFGCKLAAARGRCSVMHACDVVLKAAIPKWRYAVRASHVDQAPTCVCVQTRVLTLCPCSWRLARTPMTLTSWETGRCICCPAAANSRTTAQQAQPSWCIGTRVPQRPHVRALHHPGRCRPSGKPVSSACKI